MLWDIQKLVYLFPLLFDRQNEGLGYAMFLMFFSDAVGEIHPTTIPWGYVGITLWIVYSNVSFFHFFFTFAFTIPISHGSFIGPE